MSAADRMCESGEEAGATEVDLQVSTKDKKTHHLKSKRDGEDLDVVYKKLAVINGEINKMTREELKDKLKELKLDTRGIKEVLKKRLKSHYRQRKLMKARVKPPGGTPYDYLLVIDFEATCEENNSSFKHEIIEFPVILIDVHQMQVVDEFHSYCKPKVNQRLSKFCSTLTGITQSSVDSADHFSTVLMNMESWMESHHLGSGNKFAVVTDGPWDMSRFLSMQCYQDGTPFPNWAKKWVNIRKSYSNFYQCKRAKLENMLISMGMKFEGNLHCGLHDSRNIARIAIRLLQDGCAIKVNEYIYFDKTNGSDNATAEFRNMEEQTVSESDDSLVEFSEDTKCKSEDGVESDSTHSAAIVQKLNQSVETLTLEEENEKVDDLLEYFRLQKT